MARHAHTRARHYRVVRPHRHGWEVRGNGTGPGIVTSTKPEAVGRALEMLRRLGGGQLVVQDAHGRRTARSSLESQRVQPRPAGTSYNDDPT